MSSCPAYIPCSSPNGLDLPIELKIPLPPSRASSESGGDGQPDIESDRCFLPRGPMKAAQSLGETSPPTAEVADNEIIDHDSKETNRKAPVVSLDDLAQLVELEQFESHQSLSIQDSLKQLYLTVGLDKRLGRIASLTYRRMVSSYKASDPVGFVATYQAYEDLSNECRATMFGLQVGRQPNGGGDLATQRCLTPITPWTQRLSPATQEDILMFLVNIRTNDTLLSDCISRLSPTELTALTASYQPVALVGSVLQNHSHVKVRAEGSGSRSGNLAPGLDALRTGHRNDPYYLLLYGVFDDSAKAGSKEYHRRFQTWSTACARVLMDGKRGSDEFAITTLDAFAGLQTWAQVPQLEAFLMKCLHEGAFLLDPPQPTNFKQPVEIRNAQAVIAGSHFFDQALKLLFQILADGPLAAGVPESALDFAHATLRKIGDPRVRLKAKTFIISRWYFQCFLSNVLVYPESHGILMEHHVGETARRMILQELAHRMQKVVADVLSPWNHTTIVAPEIQAFVAQILGLFEPPSLAVITPDPCEDSTVPVKNLTLSLDDVICLMEFFYPDLFLSLPTTASDGSAPSTASSVAGSSTLMASSVTPSSSGTSITTHEFNSEDSIATKVKEKEEGSPAEVGSLENPLLEKPFQASRLKICYYRLKEIITSESSTASGRSSRDWAIIYIARNGAGLSTEPDCFDEVPLDPSSHLALRNNSSDVTVLTNAVTRLMMDRSTFQDLAIKLGHETVDLTDNRSILKGLFDLKSSNSKRNFDFTDSNFWWKASRSLNELSSQHIGLDDLLRFMRKDLQASITYHEAIRKRCSALCRSLEILGSAQKNAIRELTDRRRALRIKMWYISDVRHSATYEDALHVTRALRAMASSSRVKQPGGISTWARHRLRNSLGTDRSEAQTLEILTAHKDHGGLSKLADEQIDLTWRWLTRNSIENFCKGEERIHRFCYEVQKCANKLAGGNLLESPVLWSSRLFEQEKSMFNTRPSRSSNHEPLPRSVNDESSLWSNERFRHPHTSQISWGAPVARTATIPNSSMSRVDEVRSGLRSSAPGDSPELEIQSRLKFSSGITTIPYPLQTHQSAAPLRSCPIHNTPSEEMMSAKNDFTQHVKRILGNLIISDLGYLLWVYGTETDAWINTYASCQVSPLPHNNHKECKFEGNGNSSWPRTLLETSDPPDADASARKELQTQNPSPDITFESSSSRINGSPQQSPSSPLTAKFPYKEAYKSILDRFSYTSDPYEKLNLLSELHGLVSTSLDESSSVKVTGDVTEPHLKNNSAEPAPVSNRAMNVPRTKATSLEEVIANCTERRISTLKLRPYTEGLAKGSHVGTASPSLSTTDPVVFALQDIFRDPSLRPATLFRDLQYIAAFVPSSVLDHPSQGTAFWDAGLAALALKEELCASMITRATEITTYHINGPSNSTPQSPALATTNMRDAAHLWLLAAKEGSPVAARELGLFYLTHPQLLPLVTFPFSKGKDVFRNTLTHERGPSGNGGKGGNFAGGSGGSGLETSPGTQPGRLDAWTFALVFHWMEVAANGGDRDASDFLRGNGELSGAR